MYGNYDRKCSSKEPYSEDFKESGSENNFDEENIYVPVDLKYSLSMLNSKLADAAKCGQETEEILRTIPYKVFHEGVPYCTCAELASCDLNYNLADLRDLRDTAAQSLDEVEDFSRERLTIQKPNEKNSCSTALEADASKINKSKTCKTYSGPASNRVKADLNPDSGLYSKSEISLKQANDLVVEKPDTHSLIDKGACKQHEPESDNQNRQSNPSRTYAKNTKSDKQNVLAEPMPELIRIEDLVRIKRSSEIGSSAARSTRDTSYVGCERTAHDMPCNRSHTRSDWQHGSLPESSLPSASLSGSRRRSCPTTHRRSQSSCPSLDSQRVNSYRGRTSSYGYRSSLDRCRQSSDISRPGLNNHRGSLTNHRTVPSACRSYHPYFTRPEMIPCRACSFDCRYCDDIPYYGYMNGYCPSICQDQRCLYNSGLTRNSMNYEMERELQCFKASNIAASPSLPVKQSSSEVYTQVVKSENILKSSVRTVKTVTLSSNSAGLENNSSALFHNESFRPVPSTLCNRKSAQSDPSYTAVTFGDNTYCVQGYGNPSTNIKEMQQQRNLTDHLEESQKQKTFSNSREIRPNRLHLSADLGHQKQVHNGNNLVVKQEQAVSPSINLLVKQEKAEDLSYSLVVGQEQAEAPRNNLNLKQEQAVDKIGVSDFFREDNDSDLRSTDSDETEIVDVVCVDESCTSAIGMLQSKQSKKLAVDDFESTGKPVSEIQTSKTGDNERKDRAGSEMPIAECYGKAVDFETCGNDVTNLPRLVLPNDVDNTNTAVEPIPAKHMGISNGSNGFNEKGSDGHSGIYKVAEKNLQPAETANANIWHEDSLVENITTFSKYDKVTTSHAIDDPIAFLTELRSLKGFKNSDNNVNSRVEELEKPNHLKTTLEEDSRFRVINARAEANSELMHQSIAEAVKIKRERIVKKMVDSGEEFHEEEYDFSGVDLENASEPISFTTDNDNVKASSIVIENSTCNNSDDFNGASHSDRLRSFHIISSVTSKDVALPPSSRKSKAEGLESQVKELEAKAKRLVIQTPEQTKSKKRRYMRKMRKIALTEIKPKAKKVKRRKRSCSAKKRAKAYKSYEETDESFNCDDCTVSDLHPNRYELRSSRLRYGYLSWCPYELRPRRRITYIDTDKESRNDASSSDENEHTTGDVQQGRSDTNEIGFQDGAGFFDKDQSPRSLLSQEIAIADALLSLRNHKPIDIKTELISSQSASTGNSNRVISSQWEPTNITAEVISSQSKSIRDILEASRSDIIATLKAEFENCWQELREAHLENQRPKLEAAHEKNIEVFWLMSKDEYKKKLEKEIAEKRAELLRKCDFEMKMLCKCFRQELWLKIQVCVCGKVGQLSCCGICQSVFYCSKKCQIRDKASHLRVCGKHQRVTVKSGAVAQ